MQTFSQNLKRARLWNLTRENFRVSLDKGRLAKLNTYENCLTARDLKFYCWKLKPIHVYFSVLRWLFPERVGRRNKARYRIPLNGEYVIDVDSYLVLEKHGHRQDSHGVFARPAPRFFRKLLIGASLI